mgnify:CR=1 FL=1
MEIYFLKKFLIPDNISPGNIKVYMYELKNNQILAANYQISAKLKAQRTHFYCISCKIRLFNKLTNDGNYARDTAHN